MNWWVENTKRLIQHFLILASTITGSISVSTFAPLLGIPLGITSFAIGLKFAHGLLTRSKLNSMEVLIEVLISWNSLIDSNISDSLAI